MSFRATEGSEESQARSSLGIPKGIDPRQRETGKPQPSAGSAQS